jgi:hypothetical protein
MPIISLIYKTNILGVNNVEKETSI